MNIEDCLTSNSSSTTTATATTTTETAIAVAIETTSDETAATSETASSSACENKQIKNLKNKSNQTDCLETNCSPAKRTRLINEEEQQEQEQEVEREGEASASTESSSSTNVKNLFKSVRHNTHKPIQNNDIQNPRQLLAHLVPNLDINKIPSSLDDFDICRLVYKIMSQQEEQEEHQDENHKANNTNADLDLNNLDLPSSSAALNHASAISSLFLTQRDKLTDINTIEQCVDLISKCSNIIVLTGAGCSVSCGIPDFRSRDGIYARLRIDFPDLPDPQSMFDIFYFEHDPRPFFKFAKEIYPGQFKPSLSHMFIKQLELNNKLLRNYTQNIDTLELTADIKNVIQCHGSFKTATCTLCKYKVNCDYIKEKIFNQEIPYCDKCPSNNNNNNELNKSNKEGEGEEEDDLNLNKPQIGILKPDIIFFGEGLPEEYHKSINEDKNKCDLLIVIGSSLKVKPVANIPHLLPKNIPQILINRESLKHMNFDIELLGDCDVIVNELLMRLEQQKQKLENSQIEWSQICKEKILLNKIENQEADKYLFYNLNSNSNSNEEINLNDSDLSEYQLNPNRIFNKDYLSENSFLYLKPNIYIFHGAEVSIRNMKKKIKRLRNLCAIDNLDEVNKQDGVIDDVNLLDTEDEFSLEDETDEDEDNEESSEEEEEEEEDDDEDEDEEEDDDDDNDENESEEKSNLKNLQDDYNEEDDEEDDEDFNLDQKTTETDSNKNKEET